MGWRWYTIAPLLIVFVLPPVLVIIGIISSSIPRSYSYVKGNLHHGVNFTSYRTGGYHSDQAKEQINRLQRDGITTLVVTIPWYQDTTKSTAIARSPTKSPTDDDLREIAAYAEHNRMRVVFQPHVEILDGSFRGDIDPPDRFAWMRSYHRFIDHVTMIANQTKVRALVIGTELSSMSNMTAQWQTLIRHVRDHFTGIITYAANWDGEVQRIGFWGDLDLVGVDAYMPLAVDVPDPTVANMMTSWGYWKDQLHQISQQTGKPVVLTEIGYPQCTNAANAPYGGCTGEPSEGAQQRAYQATIASWTNTPWLAGIWWWDWAAEPNAKDTPSLDAYRIAGNPAEQALRTWANEIR